MGQLGLSQIKYNAQQQISRKLPASGHEQCLNSGGFPKGKTNAEAVTDDAVTKIHIVLWL